jgi:hypothetical protein
MVFIIAAGANVAAALLAIVVLKPWRARVIAAEGNAVGLAQPGPEQVAGAVR